nr:nucleotide sugar dehydrogenase [Candidatus Sigynarchaeum springense]MDO8119507.1 nucleotide sugar dehydrogenase [Candidatus Sigynarchaeota archaeon]
MDEADDAFVIGMWHLGCVAAACLAKLGFRITCFDSDTRVINGLEKGKFPVHEPGLPDLFKEGVARNKIHFSRNPEMELPGSSIVYITHDTPVDENDQIDLTPIHESIDFLMPLLSERSILLISSQMPVGMSDGIVQRLRRSKKNNEVCYFPENLRLGDAIKGFLTPDRMIFGLSSHRIKNDIERLFSGIPAKKVFMDLKGAEMTKHALNSYLATNISFSSELSDLCEAAGVNAITVMNAVKLDKRVGEHAPINPGLGFGGGHLARDVNVLRGLGRARGIKTGLLDAVLSVNLHRMEYISNKLVKIFGSLENKKITFLGLTYKANTSTLRRSLALQSIDQIKTKKTCIIAYDPMIKGDIPGYPHVKVCNTVKEAVNGSDALVITTPWEEFKTLDYLDITKDMRSPVIIDTANILEPTLFENTDIQYHGIGVSYESRSLK